MEGVSVYFYENTGAGPGEEIGMQQITTFEVTPIEEFGEMDHSTISLNLNSPVFFEAQIDAPTTYWVGLLIDYPADKHSFLEMTDQFDTENATYFYDFEYEDWTDGANPMWPGGGFLHAMVSLYGECSTLGLADFDDNAITHFVQNKTLFVQAAETIQAVEIYNLVGQQVNAKTIHATSGSLDLRTLKAGVYIAKVNTNEKVKSFKILVK